MREGPLSYNQVHRLGQDRHDRELGIVANPHFATTAYRVSGDLDHDALERALAAVLARHPGLDVRVDLEAGTWSAPDEARPARLVVIHDDVGVVELLDRHLRAPLDPLDGPLIRCVVAHGRDGTGLGLVMDHLVSDGWSLNVLLRDLSRCYEEALAADGAVPEAFDPDILDYREYARQQRLRFEGERGRATLDHWVRQLHDIGPVPRTELPGFSGLSHVDYSSNETLDLQLGGPRWDAVRRTARRLRLSPTNVVLAALHAAIADLTGEKVAATTLSTANRDRVDSEESIGWYASKVITATEPGRHRTADDELLALKSVLLTALDFGDMPWPKLIDVMTPGELGRQTSVPYVTFNSSSHAFASAFPPFGLVGVGLQDLPIQLGWHDAAVGTFVHESDDGCRVRFMFKTQWYPRSSVEDLATAVEAHLTRLGATDA